MDFAGHYFASFRFSGFWTLETRNLRLLVLLHPKPEETETHLPVKSTSVLVHLRLPAVVKDFHLEPSRERKVDSTRQVTEKAVGGT